MKFWGRRQRGDKGELFRTLQRSRACTARPSIPNKALGSDLQDMQQKVCTEDYTELRPLATITILAVS